MSGREGREARWQTLSCLYSQQRTRRRKRRTSDCLRLWSSLGIPKSISAIPCAGAEMGDSRDVLVGTHFDLVKGRSRGQYGRRRVTHEGRGWAELGGPYEVGRRALERGSRGEDGGEWGTTCLGTVQGRLTNRESAQTKAQRRRPLCNANSPRAGAGVKVRSENFLIPTFRHLIPSEDGEELRQESYSPWELRRRVAE